METLCVTLPLFFFLLGGVLLRRFFHLSDEAAAGLNKLAYYVGMPALIFKGIASFDFRDTFRLDMVAHNLLTTGILFFLSFGLAFLVRKKTRRGAFHLSCFRSNIGYIGLPVVNGFYGEEAMSRAAVINGFDSPYCVLLSILSLGVFRALQGTEKSGKSGARLLLSKLGAFLYNPFLIATVLGLAASFFRIPVMQTPIVSSLVEMCASIALPLALLSIGASLKLGALKGGLGPLSAVCAIRLFAAPALGFLLGKFLFGFSGADLAFTALLCGTPVSVSSFVLAGEMDADKEFSAAAIGVSTLCSIVTLSALQLILKTLT